MDNCKSFNFIIDENSEILILGSMPSVKSLSEKQYYAHPKNRFWKVMGLICDYDLYNSSYERKIEIILKNRFAIWDVIKTCKRKGSGMLILCRSGNLSFSVKKEPSFRSRKVNSTGWFYMVWILRRRWRKRSGKGWICWKTVG